MVKIEMKEIHTQAKIFKIVTIVDNIESTNILKYNDLSLKYEKVNDTCSNLETNISLLISMAQTVEANKKENDARFSKMMTRTEETFFLLN